MHASRSNMGRRQEDFEECSDIFVPAGMSFCFVFEDFPALECPRDGRGRVFSYDMCRNKLMYKYVPSLCGIGRITMEKHRLSSSQATSLPCECTAGRLQSERETANNQWLRCEWATTAPKWNEVQLDHGKINNNSRPYPLLVGAVAG